MLHEDVATTAPVPPGIPIIIDQLKEILAEDLDIKLKREEIDETVPLLEEGLALDSVVIIELIGRIEDRFGFRFGDENLRNDLFKNLTTLAEFIADQAAPAGRRA
jgi:acyl carrier protein